MQGADSTLIIPSHHINMCLCQIARLSDAATPCSLQSCKLHHNLRSYRGRSTPSIAYIENNIAILVPNGDSRCLCCILHTRLLAHAKSFSLSSSSYLKQELQPYLKLGI